MGFDLSPLARWTGYRKEPRESEATEELVDAKVAPTVDGEGSPGVGSLGAAGLGELTEIGCVRRLPALEQESKVVDGAAVSRGTANSTVETQFDRAVDDRAPGRVAVTPGKTARERLRRPLMLGLPIVLVAFGAAYYLAE
jgi:hypothetical protein